MAIEGRSGGYKPNPAELSTDLLLTGVWIAKIICGGLAFLAPVMLGVRGEKVDLLVTLALLFADNVGFELLARELARRRGRSDSRRLVDIVKISLSYLCPLVVLKILEEIGLSFWLTMLIFALPLAIEGARWLWRRSSEKSRG